ncbi:MAG TPA: FKBP-type peptidyl-prolyl cis-trans isomerase [Draconibacterium sp.]|jgi:FKBP-type peptidyl-prolyl cis-trans isomerase|nr:FKBP-type peptidyl-prolyl cis-trans isomerase [Draconibacterium sp.]
MIKTIKTAAVLLSLAILISLSSCVNDDNVPDRTAATEQQELDKALANLEAESYDIDTTDLGVFYIMNKVGTGPVAQSGDTCFLIYTGYFLDGTIFDTSANYFPTDSIWKFNYMEVNLIPGFNDGIALLNKGAEADIIIPSEFAYGPNGYNEIPPYTPLVFSLKMRDLKPKQ